MESELFNILGDIFYVIIFLFGLCMGSFVNSWIWRRYENIRIMHGRSICPSCRRQLKWYENIPILGYIFLKGRCRTCHKPIPPHFVWVELMTAFLFVFISWHFLEFGHYDSALYYRNIIFAGFLLIIFIYDLLYQIILPEIVWLGAMVGFFVNYIFFDISLTAMFLGIIIGSGFFLFQYIVSKGRWIGGGDVRLGVMIGTFLAWPNILTALFLAYISGAITGVFLLLFKGKKMDSQIPFGSFLALSTMAVLLFGQEILAWYLGLLAI
ncbi:MAG: hypothetical protein COU31_02940 [Candidatus Magasanikbacteria bacterium CG10_big_fil_rev_8_21_14_0_10_40_10]|uniref:Prepilin peptidase n=1 Tax=Candidatus Magasanikbacteria bacterium CG10_big_fil_rev_8_21_14_0_10_40_10 TaxID=1974648 RepID=A0A2M6W3Q2_9BACT|nr:MAG: hypothetical protein COU31_02940 [Candidatus Magasanikbacteria bacterium CG10_big_fil_rev_8_21_14_0_10_40_10]